MVLDHTHAGFNPSKRGISNSPRGLKSIFEQKLIAENPEHRALFTFL
jgi:hypothetical protein